MPAGTVSVGTVVSMVGICAAICNMTSARQSTVNTVGIGSGWTTAKDMFVWGGLLAIYAVLTLTLITYPIGVAIIGM